MDNMRQILAMDGSARWESAKEKALPITVHLRPDGRVQIELEPLEADWLAHALCGRMQFENFGATHGPTLVAFEIHEQVRHTLYGLKRKEKLEDWLIPRKEPRHG